MSDIVERLRDPNVSCATWNAIRHEAADEIERLRAALALSQSQNYCTLCGRDLDRAQAGTDGNLPDCGNVTKVEIINHAVDPCAYPDRCGRVFVYWDPDMRVTAQLQDSGRTLKIFLGRRGAASRRPADAEGEGRVGHTAPLGLQQGRSRS